MSSHLFWQYVKIGCLPSSVIILLISKLPVSIITNDVILVRITAHQGKTVKSGVIWLFVQIYVITYILSCNSLITSSTI